MTPEETLAGVARITEAFEQSKRELAEARAEVARLQEGQSLIQDDLAALLRALGMGDHARPESPHEVMLSAIAGVERLRVWRDEVLGHGVVSLMNKAGAEVERLRRILHETELARDERWERAKQTEAKLKAVVEAGSALASAAAQSAADLDPEIEAWRAAVKDLEQSKTRQRVVVEALESCSIRLDAIGWMLESTTPRETVARLAHSERDSANAALAAAKEEPTAKVDCYCFVNRSRSEGHYPYCAATQEKP